jgi:hypothetical protein
MSDLFDNDDNEMENRRLYAKQHPLQLQINELNYTIQMLLDSTDDVGTDDFLMRKKN